MEQSPDGSSRPQELRDVRDRRRAISVARAGGQVRNVCRAGGVVLIIVADKYVCNGYKALLQ